MIGASSGPGNHVIDIEWPQTRATTFTTVIRAAMDGGPQRRVFLRRQALAIHFLGAIAAFNHSTTRNIASAEVKPCSRSAP